MPMQQSLEFAADASRAGASFHTPHINPAEPLTAAARDGNQPLDLSRHTFGTGKPGDKPTEANQPAWYTREGMKNKAQGWSDKISSPWMIRTKEYVGISHPITSIGENAKDIDAWLIEKNIKMDRTIVRSFYTSLSADERSGAAEVKYVKEVDDLIRHGGSDKDTKNLFEYFEKSLGKEEFARRKDVLLWQANELERITKWNRALPSMAKFSGVTQENMKEWGKAIGMGEYFPAFKPVVGKPSNAKYLAAFRELGAAGEIERELGTAQVQRRIAIMEAMDRQFWDPTLLRDLDARLVTEWQEQNLDVPRMLATLDITRFVAKQGRSVNWRNNPKALDLVYWAFQPIAEEASNVARGRVQTGITLEDQRIIKFFDDDPEAKRMYESLKTDVHIGLIYPKSPQVENLVQTTSNTIAKNRWTGLLTNLWSWLKKVFGKRRNNPELLTMTADPPKGAPLTRSKSSPN
ncbi:hypothetical protein PGT21_035266 [Puccinia graminis f. sp. tritici]|nr:hypothetical protein PGT21_035266 [Puccinia graminis f. sp. tritici]